MTIEKALITDATDTHRLHDKAVRVLCKALYTAKQTEAWLEAELSLRKIGVYRYIKPQNTEKKLHQ